MPYLIVITEQDPEEVRVMSAVGDTLFDAVDKFVEAIADPKLAARIVNINIVPIKGVPDGHAELQEPELPQRD